MIGALQSHVVFVDDRTLIERLMKFIKAKVFKIGLFESLARFFHARGRTGPRLKLEGVTLWS